MPIKGAEYRVLSILSPNVSIAVLKYFNLLIVLHQKFPIMVIVILTMYLSNHLSKLYQGNRKI